MKHGNLTQGQIETIAQVLGIAPDFVSVETKRKSGKPKGAKESKYMQIATLIEKRPTLQNLTMDDLFVALHNMGHYVSRATAYQAYKAWKEGKV